MLIGQPSVAQLENKEMIKGQLSVAQTKDIKESISNLSDNQLQLIDYQNKLILLIGWTHHIILIQKIKDLLVRYWYMQQIIKNGWSRDVLIEMIKNQLHLRQGFAITNFELTLPPLQSGLAKQILKDPYIFDFS